jgi:predicted membrane channel-forming protein YqfA (hemolysin III family)
MIVLLVLVFVIIILVDVPPLIKQRMWRELAAFSVFFIIGVVYSLGQFYHWPLPNPVKGLEMLFTIKP